MVPSKTSRKSTVCGILSRRPSTCTTTSRRSAWENASPSAARAGERSVTDSAGVRLVQHDAKASTAVTDWRIDPTPALLIGHEGEEEYEFSRIGSGLLLDDDGVVVLDWRIRELRKYDRTGRHLWTVGGGGEGPGEFRTPQSVYSSENGVLRVVDNGPSLVTFSTDGELLSSDRFPEAVGAT